MPRSSFINIFECTNVAMLPDFAGNRGTRLGRVQESTSPTLWGRRFLTGVLMGTLIWDLAEYGLFASYLIFK